MPLNEIPSLHTPNYADLNILLPETVKSIEIIRGPFSVEYGDSNLGGSVNITTKESEPFATMGVSGGTQGTVRGVGTYSTTQSAWLPYLALEGYRTDGYRDNSFVNRYNSFNKITTALPDGATVSFRAQAYGTEFGAPGYSNRDAVPGRVDFGTLGDQSNEWRQQATGEFRPQLFVRRGASVARERGCQGILSWRRGG